MVDDRCAPHHQDRRPPTRCHVPVRWGRSIVGVGEDPGQADTNSTPSVGGRADGSFLTRCRSDSPEKPCLERVQIGENHRSQLSYGDGAVIIGDVRRDRRPPRPGESDTFGHGACRGRGRPLRTRPSERRPHSHGADGLRIRRAAIHRRGPRRPSVDVLRDARRRGSRRVGRDLGPPCRMTYCVSDRLTPLGPGPGGPGRLDRASGVLRS
jgi:hypothetical protein